MEEKLIKIQDISLPYSIIIDKRLRGYKIILELEGIKLYVPALNSSFNPEAILKSKGNWIYKNYKKMSITKAKVTAPKLWITGERVLYQGKSFPIEAHNQFQLSDENFKTKRTAIKFNLSTIKIFSAENNKKLITINFAEECFLIYQYVNLPVDVRSQLLEEAFRVWYIEKARFAIKKSLEYYKNKMGVNFQQFRIKEQKTRWGSCSGKANLNFNWKLILAPEETLNYVVVHELSHLKEMNHSKRFWDEVEKWMPDYKNHIAYLKNNLNYINNWNKNIY
jgi:predicted metal-dependent hydrolase